MSTKEEVNKHELTAAIAMGSVGALWIALGGTSMLVMTFQKAIFSFSDSAAMPNKPPEEMRVIFESFEQLVATLHGIWVVWMPILCLVGVFWVVCGVLLGFGGRQWRTLSLVAVGCALVWTLGYSHASMDFIDAFKSYGESFPMAPSFLSEFWTVSALFGFAVFLLKPLAVGYIVWRA